MLFTFFFLSCMNFHEFSKITTNQLSNKRQIIGYFHFKAEVTTVTFVDVAGNTKEHRDWKEKLSWFQYKYCLGPASQSFSSSTSFSMKNSNKIENTLLCIGKPEYKSSWFFEKDTSVTSDEIHESETITSPIQTINCSHSDNSILHAETSLCFLSFSLSLCVCEFVLFWFI